MSVTTHTQCVQQHCLRCCRGSFWLVFAPVEEEDILLEERGSFEASERGTSIACQRRRLELKCTREEGLDSTTPWRRGQHDGVVTCASRSAHDTKRHLLEADAATAAQLHAPNHSTTSSDLASLAQCIGLRCGVPLGLIRARYSPCFQNPTSHERAGKTESHAERDGKVAIALADDGKVT
jgi:hypothetical protein